MGLLATCHLTQMADTCQGDPGSLFGSGVGCLLQDRPPAGLGSWLALPGFLRDLGPVSRVWASPSLGATGSPG